MSSGMKGSTVGSRVEGSESHGGFHGVVSHGTPAFVNCTPRDMPRYVVQSKGPSFVNNDLFSARHVRGPSISVPYFQPFDSLHPHSHHQPGVSIDPRISHTFAARSAFTPLFAIRVGNGRLTVSACFVYAHSLDLRSPDFGVPLSLTYLCQLIRATVIILQGALAEGAGPFRPNATVLEEASSACPPFPLHSVLASHKSVVFFEPQPR